MSKKLKLLLIISLIVIFATIGAFVSIKYINYIINNKYIQYDKRDTYVLNDIDDTLLKNYLSKSSNTLVIFWASWCPSCLNEKDDINSFITNNQNIPVIIVSHDREIETLQNYLQENNLKWQVIFDKEKLIRQSIDSQTRAIPACFLINRKGEVINSYVGVLNSQEILDFYNLNLNK